MLRDNMRELASKLPLSRIKLRKVGAFITFRSYDLAGRHIVWRARHQRKGLDRVARAIEEMPIPLWQTHAYNWTMGAIFALGSALFMLGSLLSLLPAMGGVSAAMVNLIFFLGSIPFTVAAYLQHFQAANASPFAVDPTAQNPASPIAWIGWRPRDAGWLSTLAQFLGTLAFNVNTFDAMHSPTAWYLQDVAIWVPDMVGSALFLVSAYLAFIETCHAYWAWRPRRLDWQIVSVNLVGCIAFMISAVLAFTPSGPEAAWITFDSNLQLLLGATGFLVGALLTMRESRQAA